MDNPYKKPGRLDLSNPYKADGYAASVPWSAMRDIIRQSIESFALDGSVDTKSISMALDHALIEFRDSWKTISSQIAEGCSNLAKHGWYPDRYWGWDFLPELAGEDISQLEPELVEHFDGRASDLCEEICYEHEARREIIEQAFEAHTRGEYALSVPVLLSQAEGLTVDFLGRRGYRACQSTGGVESYELGRHLHNDSKEDILVRPFFEAFVPRPSLLAAGSDSRHDPPADLNRHLVLHGIDIGYQTRVNSCKAISWLQWVDWALATSKTHRDQGNKPKLQ